MQVGNISLLKTITVGPFLFNALPKHPIISFLSQGLKTVTFGININENFKNILLDYMEMLKTKFNKRIK